MQFIDNKMYRVKRPYLVSREWIAVADPGFPRGGGANPKGGGAPTYYLANFSQKLHENKEILVQRGGARPSRPPLDPPLDRNLFHRAS